MGNWLLVIRYWYLVIGIWGMHIKHLDKSIKFGAYEYTPESD
jgi:hypothetical protein